jgi:hypothetical protein
MYALWAEFLHQMILFLLQVALISISALIHMLGMQVMRWLEHHTTLNQRQIVYQIASEAVMFAERAFVNLSGSGKLDEAIRYAESAMTRKGILISPEELRASIEQAVHIMNTTSYKTDKGVSAGS